MFRWIPLVGGLLATSCVVTPPLILQDDNSQRIDAAMKPELYNPQMPAALGIALGPEAPPMAEPFPEPPPWQRYVPAYRNAGHRRGGPIPPAKPSLKRPGA